MAEYIACRRCDSPDCKGCNLKRLETMLENGKFDCLMNENRAINTSADVAPVVRCKDCAHRTEMGNCGHPRYHGILPSAYPYDFCSYGARKDGDDDAKAD